MADNLIKIENCNNITECSFNITDGLLNIKYAINGTGKSTIAQSIKLSADGKSLNELMPFGAKLQKDRKIIPSVSALPYNNIAIFDEAYLKGYVYQKSELLKNTFAVMIQSQKYNELKQQIDEQLKGVKQVAEEKPNLAKIEEITQSLCEMLVVNASQPTLSRRIKGVKSLLDDKKGALFNAPDELKEFTPFISDEKSSEWAAWKFKGISAFGTKGICPYCASKEDEQRKKQEKIFQDSFNEESVMFSNKLKSYLDRLSLYINSDKMSSLLKSIDASTERSVLEMQLVKLRSEADYLSRRLYVLSHFSGYSIDQNNMNEFEDKFKDMIIRIDMLDFFNTSAFLKEIEPLNTQVSNTLSMIGSLKGEVAKFHKYLRDTIMARKNDVNDFLVSAGFNYTFDIIIDDNETAHALLKYKYENEDLIVDNPDKHLSWGEKNAFALLLFMYDAISRNADLIILDDPISSFDSNKKYAIMNRIFKTGDRDNSLYQKTVLMLTHDFEPIIDYIQVGGKISGDSVKAHYLYNNKGSVKEVQIKKNDDICPSIHLMQNLAKDNTLPISVRIGCLRKYIEYTEGELKIHNGYNLLSSLIHGRNQPTNDNAGTNIMSEEQIEKALEYIKNYINDFDYDEILKKHDGINLINEYKRQTNNNFKLLILRNYIEHNQPARERLKDFHEVLRKFVDETYHIENDYLYSLDIRKFDIVPEYYKIAADKFMDEEAKLSVAQ